MLTSLSGRQKSIYYPPSSPLHPFFPFYYGSRIIDCILTRYLNLMAHPGKYLTSLLGWRRDGPIIKPWHADIRIAYLCLVYHFMLCITTRKNNVLSHIPNNPCCKHLRRLRGIPTHLNSVISSSSDDHASFNVTVMGGHILGFRIWCLSTCLRAHP